jgi:inner membrane protein
MDNLAHTLTGAALGEAGLKEKTGLGLATLMIAANLPDLDALGLLVGENLAWRRGWTHGPIGLLVLPPLLAGVMLAFDRWQARRGTRPPDRLPVRAGWLLALAYIGAISHPLLDLLNTYGVRLLMPFSERWFYGDTLFIIDVWLWTMLALGVWLTRRRRRGDHPRPRTPALASLALAVVYIGVMGAGSATAERMTAHAAEARGLGPVGEVVASPVPVDPFRRRMAFEIGDAYGFGEVRWTPQPELRLSPELVPTNMDDPAVAEAARRSKGVADFLYWSRLPFAKLERRPDVTLVTIGDARYSDGLSSGTFTRIVRLPSAAAPGEAPPARPAAAR